MELTKKQEEGLKIAVDRYRANEKYTVIAGYAGTGKSTLIKFIIEALQLNPERDVAYVSYTGKAAQVLNSKGCPNATTAHKLLYYSKQMKNGKYSHQPRKTLEHNYKVIVVDEISMLPKTLWELLLSHKVYVIACGDPGQLPPIYKTEDNHVLDNPHVFLDEIMRQALDSEIIRLSMWIRQGRPIAQFKGEQQEVMCIHHNEITDNMLTWADQVLCATNKTRHSINTHMRELYGHTHEPQIGDKVISLRNQWDFCSSIGIPQPITNGLIGTIQDYSIVTQNYPNSIWSEPVAILLADILDENGDYYEQVPINYDCLVKGEVAWPGPVDYQLRKAQFEPPFEFAYGYAITTWKAQGSEFDKVLIREEGFPFNRDEHQRFLYTAVTRAKSRVVLARK